MPADDTPAIPPPDQEPVKRSKTGKHYNIKDGENLIVEAVVVLLAQGYDDRRIKAALQQQRNIPKSRTTRYIALARFAMLAAHGATRKQKRSQALAFWTQVLQREEASDPTPGKATLDQKMDALVEIQKLYGLYEHRAPLRVNMSATAGADGSMRFEATVDQPLAGMPDAKLVDHLLKLRQEYEDLVAHAGNGHGGVQGGAGGSNGAGPAALPEGGVAHD